MNPFMYVSAQKRVKLEFIGGVYNTVKAVKLIIIKTL
jgi:hypothetical protein